MAVDELLDEHEQGERVREWVRQNALGVFGGIAIALAVVYGYGKWQDHQLAQRVAAGEAYEEFTDRVAAGDLDAARALAEGAGFSDGVYGTLAALDLAAAQVAAGDGEAAIATLSSIDGIEPSLADVVARRRAVLLVDAGKADEALAALGDAGDAGSLEVRGDAHYAAGRLEQAREAWERALAVLDEAAITRRHLLEIKLIDAGGTPARSEDQTP